MRCPCCQDVMMTTSSQSFEDDHGALTITRWRCRPCHETVEEIAVGAGASGTAVKRIRYAVAPQPLRQIPGRIRTGAVRTVRVAAPCV